MLRFLRVFCSVLPLPIVQSVARDTIVSLAGFLIVADFHATSFVVVLGPNSRIPRRHYFMGRLNQRIGLGKGSLDFEMAQFLGRCPSAGLRDRDPRSSGRCISAASSPLAHRTAEHVAKRGSGSDADGEHQFLDVIHWKASDARGNINPNGRRCRLFLLGRRIRARPTLSPNWRQERRSLWRLRIFDGREGPLTPVNALESVLSFVIVKSCSK